MASKRNQRRKTCERKHRYSTMDAAAHAARRSSKRTNSWITPYGPCPHCGGYHIGHPNAQQRRELRRVRGL